MSLHNPPYYRYPLVRAWDKETFVFIKTIARSNKLPHLIGTDSDKNKYLVMLIRTQKSLHDWRDFLKDTLNQMKETGSIDALSLITKYPGSSISKEVPEWATYPADKVVSDFIDELATRKIAFVGTDEQISEFISRFILGQLSNDWESTILMIWEMLGDGNTLNVKDLNNEMKNFDYLGLFS